MMETRRYRPLGLALFLLPFAAQARQVDLTFAPTRLINLQKAISDLVGHPVAFDGTTENEVVAIDVHKVDTETFMKKLAEATSAAWIEDKGVFHLTRPSDIEHKEELAETDSLYENLVQSIKGQSHFSTDLPKSQADIESLIDLLKPKTYQSDTQRQANLGKVLNATPDSAIRAEIIGAIDPKRLINLGDNQSVTFASNPNRMQVSFASNLSSALDRFAQIKGWWASAGKKLIIEASEQNTLPDSILKAIASVPQNPKYQAAVHVIRRNNYFMASVFVYDQTGHIVTPSMNAYFQASTYVSGRYPKSGGRQPVEFGPLLTEVGKVAADLQYGAAVSKETAERLNHPQETDPLQVSLAGMFPYYAQAKHINLIADIPDQCALNFNPSDLSNKRTYTAGSLPSMLVARGGLTVTESDGWEVWKPILPYSSRKSRANRRGVERYMELAHKFGIVPIDNLADLVFEYGPNVLFLSHIVTSLTVPFHTTFYRYQQPESLMFFGSMPLNLRTALADHRLILRDLPAYPRNMLERAFYAEPFRGRRGVAVDSIMNLTTMAHPDGIPDNTPVDLQMQKWRGLLVAPPEGQKVVPYIMQFGTGTHVTLQKDQPQRYMLFDNVNATVTFAPDGDGVGLFSIYSCDNPSNPIPVTFDNLPKAVQRELEGN